MVTRYQKRISGPLMDRIDIHMQVPRMEYQKLRDKRMGETSAELRMRVEVARERQRQRFVGTGIASNMRPVPTGNIAGLGMTFCALIIFLHPEGRTSKPAERQPS